MIKDLIEISKQTNSNSELLLQDAFNRGVNYGKELAKEKAIEAIREETIKEMEEMLSKIVLKDLSGKWSEEVIDFSTSIVDATVFKIKDILNKLKK